MRVYLGITCGFAVSCLLAALASTAGGAPGTRRAVFWITLAATVTKEWKTTVETTENGCPTKKETEGLRTTKLRSSKPSKVVVTFRGSSVVSYSPAVVRFVRTEVRQSGARTTRTEAPCQVRTVRSECRPAKRAVPSVRARFFRSARNELSFFSMRLPQSATGCPGESSRVRGIRPNLSAAQGEIAEATLANPRSPGQTGFASSEVETLLEGAETGTVVARVRWALTFRPARSA